MLNYDQKQADSVIAFLNEIFGERFNFRIVPVKNKSNGFWPVDLQWESQPKIPDSLITAVAHAYIAGWLSCENDK